LIGDENDALTAAVVCVQRTIHDQLDDVSRRDDLGVHMARLWASQAGVRELGRLDALHRDLVEANAQSFPQGDFGQIYQGLSFAVGWRGFGRRLWGCGTAHRHQQRDHYQCT